ncbi:MAG: cell envelope integrity protein TolA [Treponema sp.]|nr:cell envelope integrity protein TolA [Treponema sp.]
MKTSIFPYKKIFFSILIFILFSYVSVKNGYSNLYAQEKHFEQKLEWKEDANAFEYKVEVKNLSDGKITSYTTSENFMDLNLPAGNYQYRITVYDFLGRASDVSSWQGFEITKASVPTIQNIEKAMDVVVDDAKKITIPIEIDSVSNDSTVTLINTKTNEKVEGKILVDKAVTSGKGEVNSATRIEIPEINDGEWKIVVENPSGLTTESGSIEIKTKDIADIRAEEEAARLEAARKAEEERLAREEAARKAEEERLAKEEAARKAEEERLAKEQAEQAEKERLAREEAARKAEEDRLAKEEAARKAEEERIAKEEAERRLQEEQARIARQENEDTTEEDVPLEISMSVEENDYYESEEEAKKKRRALGIDVKIGAAAMLNLFNDDLLSLKTEQLFFQDALPKEIFLVPQISLSIVPNFTWLIKPGIEFSAEGGFFSSRHEFEDYGTGETYVGLIHEFTYEMIQASLIGQLRIVPDKFFLNVKAGGGLLLTSVYTTYRGDYSSGRRGTDYHFMYPKIKAGISFEWIPLKHLVLELGTDYNMVISKKVSSSNICPYLIMGVRF